MGARSASEFRAFVVSRMRRRVGVATVLAMAIGTGEGAMRGSVPFLVATGLIAAFVVFRHRGNIARLRRGEESSVGGTKPEEQG